MKNDIVIYFEHFRMGHELQTLYTMTLRLLTSAGTKSRSMATVGTVCLIATSICGSTPVMGSCFITTMRILLQPNMIDVNGASSQIQPNESSLSTLDKLRGT